MRIWSRISERQEIQLARVAYRAHPRLAVTWWVLLAVQGALPAVFAIAMGVLVGGVQRGASLTGPLVGVGILFVLMQVGSPVLQAVSRAVGERTAAWLYDELSRAATAPPGMGHLEDPALVADLTVAREFDTGMTGPPLYISIEFIATSLMQLVSGTVSVLLLFGYTWWAAPLLGCAWGTTHWWLKESAVWRDRNTDEVRSAQRDSEYAYRLAVDPPAAKELRLFGLADWTLDRFLSRRKLLHDLQYEATRLRERSVLGCLVVVVAANGVVAWSLSDALATGRLDLGQGVVFAQAMIGAASIAFGGLNWALDGASAPAAAVLRLQGKLAPAGALASGTAEPAAQAHELRFRDVSFAYPGGGPVLDGFDLTVPAGSSLAIVGQNGAGKTTLAKLLCRLYDPTSGSIESDGVDVRDLDLDAWRHQVTAVFQDFIRFELPLRDNVAPRGAPDDVIRDALAQAGAADLADLDTPLSKGYAGGTDLSGGQWQRVALARALCAVQQGAGVVLLDEPTAQLDVRGESEIFERVLAATRHCTTILVSHRFSTVRQADRICVLEAGRVVELGTHDELMAAGGRYRTMFELQAKRFEPAPDDEGVELEVLG